MITLKMDVSRPRQGKRLACGRLGKMGMESLSYRGYGAGMLSLSLSLLLL